MRLEDHLSHFVSAGVTRAYAKRLAPNDNSKNQIYLGPGFTAVAVLPAGEVHPDPAGRQTFKADLRFAWLLEDGRQSPAPHARLILYPRYPEVRLGSILRGAQRAPVEVVNSRDPHRVLLLGVCDDGRILARVATAGDPTERDLVEREPLLPKDGVLLRLPLPQRGDPLQDLLARLKRIHDRGWIRSRRLDGFGSSRPCEAGNCGGYTLEAELGIAPNSRAEPDFRGWEVKQYGVTDLERPVITSPVTLMTPEPTGGVYSEEGVIAFMRRFGYQDRGGRPDRLNFGGIHLVGLRHPRTGLTLLLTGFDPLTRRVTDLCGGLELCDDSGTIAARWDFASLLTHWKRKHSQCAYVPSECRAGSCREYRFGSAVSLGIGTEFSRLLRALLDRHVFYDPGIKLERASSDQPRAKRRSQFRVRFRDMPVLYETFRGEFLSPRP